MQQNAKIVRESEGEKLDVLGVTVRLLCEPEDTKKAWSLMENIVPRDVGPPLHEHPWDEAYFIIAGEIQFVVGDNTEVASAGDFIYAPAGTAHAFKGISEGAARMLVFDVPAHANSFFREVDRQVKQIPTDFPKLLSISERYGLHIHAK